MDVVNGRIVPSILVISGDTITSVTPNGAPPANAQVVDVLGKFLIPGLWDMHAHVERTRESSLQLYVANGVIGIRDMGSDLNFILGVREEAVRDPRNDSGAQGRRSRCMSFVTTPANLGVGILAGCDAMLAGFCVHDELVAMVRGGMTSRTLSLTH